MPLLIVGASARGAAESALFAGFQPACIDLFADADLQAIARVERSSNYPHDLAEKARLFPLSAWMYTGALENYPDVVAEISRERPLLGNDLAVLHAVRDPFAVADMLLQRGLPASPVLPSDSPPPPDGRWLLKPRRSAAGHGVAVWDAATAARMSPPGTGCYFQERLEGVLISAVFVGSGRTARLAGITRQWAGWTVLGAEPFGYCGSIGPIGVSKRLQKQIESIGLGLVEHFGLRGLFGVDLMLVEDSLFVLEVNPRYTASVEVLELALGRPLLAWHVAACEQRDLPGVATSEPPRVAAKAVQFALAPLRPVDLDELSVRATDVGTTSDSVWLADIPAADVSIECGQPVCTVLSVAGTAEQCLNQLAERIDWLQSRLFARETGRDVWDAELRLLRQFQFVPT